MTLELLLAGIVFFAQVLAWTTLPLRAPRQIKSDR
jgi:hypothetical protein